MAAAIISLTLSLLIVGSVINTRHRAAPTSPASQEYAQPPAEYYRPYELSVRTERKQQDLEHLNAAKDLERAQRDHGVSDREHKLDTAEQHYQLKLRERQYCYNGVLPPRKPPAGRHCP